MNDKKRQLSQGYEHFSEQPRQQVNVIEGQ
jgi:hypothetical protein